MHTPFPASRQFDGEAERRNHPRSHLLLSADYSAHDENGQRGCIGILFEDPFQIDLSTLEHPKINRRALRVRDKRPSRCRQERMGATALEREGNRLEKAVDGLEAMWKGSLRFLTCRDKQNTDEHER